MGDKIGVTVRLNAINVVHRAGPKTGKAKANSSSLSVEEDKSGSA